MPNKKPERMCFVKSCTTWYCIPLKDRNELCLLIMKKQFQSEKEWAKTIEPFEKYAITCDIEDLSFENVDAICEVPF